MSDVPHRQLQLIDRRHRAAAHRDQRAAVSDERIERLDARFIIRGRRRRAGLPKPPPGRMPRALVADDDHVEAIAEVAGVMSAVLTLVNSKPYRSSTHFVQPASMLLGGSNKRDARLA